MPHINRTRRVSLATAMTVALLLLASLGLAACGGSSSSSTTSNAAATSSTGATGATARGAGRFQALRECLQKNGITLPKRTPGQRPRGGTGGGGFLGGGAGGAGGPQLPKGVSRAQYEAAIKKCGGGAFAGAGGRVSSPAAKQALAKFATCMRQNGVNVPEPNTSGGGPIFNSKGLDTSSPQFKAAEAKCQSDLQGAFQRGRGGRPPGAGGGAAGGTGAAEGPGGPATGPQ
jgi:hypothetical protein